MSRFPTNPQDQSRSPLGNAGQAAAEIKSKAQEAAANLGQKAQEAAGSIGQKAQEVAGTAREKADDAISTVGERMSTMAGTLREKAPREGVLGSAASAVAERLESGGQYLQHHGLSDMAGDVTSLIRQHPMQALLCGFGLGFILGMTWRR